MRLVREHFYVMNASEVFYDPSESALQMLQMLAIAAVNLTNVLQMKNECKAWLSNLHDKECVCVFPIGLYLQSPVELVVFLYV